MTICVDAQSDELKDHLMEELDYALLPEPAWNLLVRWYGLSAESRPIVRYIIHYYNYCSLKLTAYH